MKVLRPCLRAPALLVVVGGVAWMSWSSSPVLAADRTALPGASIHYAEALAHRDDQTEFIRGDAATVRLRPRSATATTTGLRREVFGFLPYWVLGEDSLRLDYEALSTIAYWGVGADASGHLTKRKAGGRRTVEWAGWKSSTITSLIDGAHASGTRVVLTVIRFSWTSAQAAATSKLLASATARATLAAEIASAVSNRGADGVNLDFEPIPSGQRDNYVLLVRKVRKALDARAPGYQLTVDGTGRAWLDGYDVAALTADGAADALFVMGYDYRVAGSARAGSISPLVRIGDDLKQTLAAYLAATTPSKIILGLPYYGRVWSTTSDALNALTRPQGYLYGYSTTVRYRTAVRKARLSGRRYDTRERSAWTAYRYRHCYGCPRTWRELYYDDTESLGVKYDLVNNRDLRGAGIWALGYDGRRTELYALLKLKFGEL
jgi:spore germination protein YaaH